MSCFSRVNSVLCAQVYVMIKFSGNRSQSIIVAFAAVMLEKSEEAPLPDGRKSFFHLQAYLVKKAFHRMGLGTRILEGPFQHAHRVSPAVCRPRMPWSCMIGKGRDDTDTIIGHIE